MNFEQIASLPAEKDPKMHLCLDLDKDLGTYRLAWRVPTFVNSPAHFDFYQLEELIIEAYSTLKDDPNPKFVEELQSFVKNLCKLIK